MDVLKILILGHGKGNYEVKKKVIYFFKILQLLVNRGYSSFWSEYEFYFIE